MTSKENHKKEKKGRRWIFSRKKMKNESDNNDNDGDDDEDIISHDVKTLLEQRGVPLKPCVNIPTTSKLIPTLADMLEKPRPREFFSNFLQEKGRKHLLDFWVDAERFRKTFRRPVWHSAGGGCDGVSPQSAKSCTSETATGDSCSVGCGDDGQRGVRESGSGAESSCGISIKNEDGCSYKTDLIDSMHLTNHEWTAQSGPNSGDIASPRIKVEGEGTTPEGEGIGVEDSLDISFGGLHVSQSVQSMSSFASSSSPVSPLQRGKNQFLDAEVIFNKYISRTSLRPPPPTTSLLLSTTPPSQHPIVGMIQNLYNLITRIIKYRKNILVNLRNLGSLDVGCKNKSLRKY